MSSSVKEVKEYTLFHYKDGTFRINLYFTDGSWDYYVGLDAARFSALTDWLRNEKPTYWTEGPDVLWTGREPVGEEEGRS